MANFKLLYLNRNYLKEFFNKIKRKYNKKDFSNLLTKFENTYFNSKPFDDLSWNYNSALINNLDNSIMFYTNNICESYNRTLNLRFVVAYKNILNFEC